MTKLKENRTGKAKRWRLGDSGKDTFVTCSVTRELAGTNHNHSSLLGNSHLATT